MTVQTAEPVTREVQEFHPISVSMTGDYTEIICRSCGSLEHTGAGAEGHVAHGADHAIATGHVVTEIRTRVTVITGRPASGGGS